MYFSGHPVTGANNRSKRSIIPVRINGNTVPASITAPVQDPYTGVAAIVLADGVGTLTDAVFVGVSLAGATPKIGVEILDGSAKDNAGNVSQGTATRFRHAEGLVIKADSAGNIAQFAVGVVEPGDGKITAKGHVQFLLKLNGTITGFIAVSGTFINIYAQWD